MSDESLHYDPVESGLPAKFDRLEVVFLVLLAALSVWYLSGGEYGEALNSALFAALVYLIGKTRRVYWIQGYKSAIQTTAEQINGEVEGTDE